MKEIELVWKMCFNGELPTDYKFKGPFKKGGKLTVVLDYYEAMETYSRIGLLLSYGNLQSYWTSTNKESPDF